VEDEPLYMQIKTGSGGPIATPAGGGIWEMDDFNAKATDAGQINTPQVIAYFQVDDFDAAVKKAKNDLKLIVAMEPTDHPDKLGKCAIFKDKPDKMFVGIYAKKN
jgi:hypothetical protein